MGLHSQHDVTQYNQLINTFFHCFDVFLIFRSLFFRKTSLAWFSFQTWFHVCRASGRRVIFVTCNSQSLSEPGRALSSLQSSRVLRAPQSPPKDQGSIHARVPFDPSIRSHAALCECVCERRGLSGTVFAFIRDGFCAKPNNNNNKRIITEGDNTGKHAGHFNVTLIPIFE